MEIQPEINESIVLETPNMSQEFQKYLLFENLCDHQAYYESAIRIGERILELNPESYWIRHRIAEIYTRLAIDNESKITKEGTSIKLVYLQYSIKYLMAALAAIKTQDPEHQLNEIKSSILLADNFKMSSNYEKAINYYTIINGKNVIYDDYCNLMIAECYLGLSDVKKAKEYFCKIDDLERPLNYYIHRSNLGRAMVAEIEGSYPEAIKIITKIFRDCSDSILILKAQQAIERIEKILLTGTKLR